MGRSRVRIPPGFRMASGVRFSIRTKTPVAASGSVGFVVYRVRVDDTTVCNPLIAWSVPWSQVSYNNQAYCDIFEEEKVDSPDDIYRKMENVDSRQQVSIKFGMMVTSQIETGTSPVYEAEFTREDVALIKRKTADQQDVRSFSVYLIDKTSTIVVSNKQIIPRVCGVNVTNKYAPYIHAPNHHKWPSGGVTWVLQWRPKFNSH
ncbi:putative cytolysin/lectin [Helianthus annuus]|nr:putative cytolysin/lectin [Helianthus annuus]